MISEKLSTDSRRMLQNGVPQFVGFCRCTPCRQRRGKVFGLMLISFRLGCTPCRQRRGKENFIDKRSNYTEDAPRAGSAEAKLFVANCPPDYERCTPCRQRRGKVVQWQLYLALLTDAPRAGSAEAKHHHHQLYISYFRCTPCRQRRGKGQCLIASITDSKDAPRAGSAEAKIAPPTIC